MKRFLVLVFTMLSLILLSSCEVGGAVGLLDSQKEITVNFVIGSETVKKTFASREEISYPDVPEVEYKIFAGWYYDKEGERPAYLGTTTDSEITLYAHYTFDYESAINDISTKYIKAAVGIKTTHPSLSSSQKVVMGSGVIFKEFANQYYVLTNYHVIKNNGVYSGAEYKVIDCYGTSYSAHLVASNAEYDLALLSFVKGEMSLCAIELSENAADVSDTVISIGTPSGLENNVTFGSITKIEELDQSESSVARLPFAVIWHDAPVDHGSSGGVLLGEDLKIVGINYAVGTAPTSGEFICGLAVPLERVLEFLENNQ